MKRHIDPSQFMAINTVSYCRFHRKPTWGFMNPNLLIFDNGVSLRRNNTVGLVHFVRYVENVPSKSSDENSGNEIAKPVPIEMALSFAGAIVYWLPHCLPTSLKLALLELISIFSDDTIEAQNHKISLTSSCFHHQ